MILETKTIPKFILNNSEENYLKHINNHPTQIGL